MSRWHCRTRRPIGWRQAGGSASDASASISGSTWGGMTGREEPAQVLGAARFGCASLGK